MEDGDTLRSSQLKKAEGVVEAVRKLHQIVPRGLDINLSD